MERLFRRQRIHRRPERIAKTNYKIKTSPKTLRVWQRAQLRQFWRGGPSREIRGSGNRGGKIAKTETKTRYRTHKKIHGRPKENPTALTQNGSKTRRTNPRKNRRKHEQNAKTKPKTLHENGGLNLTNYCQNNVRPSKKAVHDPGPTKHLQLPKWFLQVTHRKPKQEQRRDIFFR